MAENEMEVKKYKMPDVKIGDWVMYHENRDTDKGLLALVTLVAVETVTMTVVPHFAREVCRHADDPLLKVVEMAHSHCWKEWVPQVAANELAEMLPTLKKLCASYHKTAKPAA